MSPKTWRWKASHLGIEKPEPVTSSLSGYLVADLWTLTCWLKQLGFAELDPQKVEPAFVAGLSPQPMSLGDV